MTADRDDLAAILLEQIAEELDAAEHLRGTGSSERMVQSVLMAERLAQMVLESDWLRGVRAKELRDAAAVEGDPIARVARVWLLNRADRVDAEDTDNTTDRT